MANTTRRRSTASATSRKRQVLDSPNGDPGGVRLTKDNAVNLGDDLPDPPTDFVMLDDDDWIEDGAR
jgi:hypothetical protein